MTGAHGGAVGWGTALLVGRSVEFFINIILPAALWPLVLLSLNRNEYQWYFLVGKGSRCIGLTNIPPSCADCHVIWEPQPPATLRVCTGPYRDCFTFRRMINEQQVGDSNMALPKYESRVSALPSLFGHILCSIITTYPASCNSLKCITL